MHVWPAFIQNVHVYYMSSQIILALELQSYLFLIKNWEWISIFHQVSDFYDHIYVGLETIFAPDDMF